MQPSHGNLVCLLCMERTANTANFNFPDPKTPLALTCDASLVAVEATLKQYI